MQSSSTQQSLVGLPTCIALVVANMIGTGVFTSVGFQLEDLHSPFVILMVWVLGGIFAMCGALCYAELAATIPRSGGEYHFLGKIYHPALGFMAGMVSLLAGFSAPVALAAMAFGKYLQNIFPGISVREASLILVTFITATHLISIRLSGIFQTIITGIKILLITLFLAIGFLLAPPNTVLSFLPPIDCWSKIFSPPFAISLMFAMFSYSGWNAAIYISGEVRHPEKNVGRALLIGTLIVTIVYVLLNAIFLLAAPSTELQGQLDVGRIASEHLMGKSGGILISGLICLGIVASISAMTWAGPRVSTTMGEDHWILRWFTIRSTAGIPWVAALFQYAIVVFLLLTASFEGVLIYSQFSLVACSLLTSLGVIVLRKTQPNLPRPFRCWAYPMPSLLFCMISIFTLVYSTINKPWESLAGTVTLLIFVTVYFATKKLQKKK